MTSTIETDELPRYDPPELIALCREDEDGGEVLAGWMMALPETAVAYLPDCHGRRAQLSKFSSIASASRVLHHMGVYPVRNAWTMPSAPETLPCATGKPPAPPPGPGVGALLPGGHTGVTPN